MNSSSNQLAFDVRLGEAVYSGQTQSPDDELLRLVEDYSRISDERHYQSLKHDETDREVFSEESTGSSSRKSTSPESVDDLVAPLSKRRSNPFQGLQQRSFTPVSEWEGYVESIQGDEFTLRLVNIKSGTELADEEATFATSDLSAEQREKLQVGAIIRWVVGLERLPTDQRRRVSELHFRRLPAHSKKDFKRAYTNAGQLIAEINWVDAS